MLQSMVMQRVRHDLMAEQQQQPAVGLHIAFTAQGLVLIPVGGTEIPQAVQLCQKINK